jgi:hypothetical protein
MDGFAAVAVESVDVIDKLDGIGTHNFSLIRGVTWGRTEIGRVRAVSSLISLRKKVKKWGNAGIAEVPSLN